MWLIKKFEKYFMAHQYMLNIFHNPRKNSPAPSPTYLMYGPLLEVWLKFYVKMDNAVQVDSFINLV